MKNYELVLLAVIFIISSCGVNTNIPATASGTDSLGESSVENSTGRGLSARMRISDTIKIGDPVELTFAVHNDSDTPQQFCKWHTPFEPLMSKYLTVKDENGVEADYRGAMAKRMMPPPAESYIKIAAQDSLVSKVDLLKGYALTRPSRYTVTYSGQNMSGLTVSDSVSFVYR